MITDFEKKMLKKSLDFLSSKNTEPIDLSKLQTIINHASEEFSSLEEVKFKYIIENPENKDIVILGITTFNFIKELNVLSFRSDKIQEPFKVVSKKPFIQEGVLSSTLNLKNIQKIIDSVKEVENWGSILICIENLFFPNMYCIGNDNSVYVKLGEN